MTFFDRLVGVLRLDVNTYENIEADESATGQAALVVAIVALFAAVPAFVAVSYGTSVWQSLAGTFNVESPIALSSFPSPWGAALSAFVNVFIAWAVASALVYFIGTRLFSGTATFTEMLRVIGFAQVPRLLAIFSLGGIIPCLSPLITFVAWVWMLATNFVGIRQGLDIGNGKTLLTILVSWLVAVLLNAFVVAPLFSAIGL